VATLLYLVVTPIGGSCADKPHRRSMLIRTGLVTITCGLVVLGLGPLAATADPQTPAATSVPVLVLGLAMIGSGVALIDTPALPLLAALADNTLGPGVGYGAAAAVEATAMSFGQLIGPLLALPISHALDNESASAWLRVGLAPTAFATAVCCALLAPFVTCFLPRALIAPGELLEDLPALDTGTVNPTHYSLQAD